MTKTTPLSREHSLQQNTLALPEKTPYDTLSRVTTFLPSKKNHDFNFGDTLLPCVIL